MYKTYFTSRSLCFHLRFSTSIFKRKQQPYEFDDGSDVPLNKSGSNSGSTQMKASLATNNSGVQLNNSAPIKAGAPVSDSSVKNRNGSHNKRSPRSSSNNSTNDKSNNYNPINLSSPLVSKKILNNNLLTNPARFSSQENVDLKFTVKPINSHLEKQSLIWASKLDVSDIDKYRIFGRERFNGEYLSKLQQIYVYSYYKCLLLGVYEYRIDQTSDSDNCLVGHAMLYQMLYKRSYSIELNGVFVNYILDVSKEEVDFILSEAKKHSFLNEAISIYDNRFSICNTSIERYIETLRLSIEISDLDVLFVRLSDYTKLCNYTSSAVLPLANSFFSNNQEKWYYCYHEFSQINGNTLLFGKSNFITIKKLDPTVIAYFENTAVSVSQDIIIKYEVSCVSSSKFFDCNYENSYLHSPKKRAN